MPDSAGAILELQKLVQKYRQKSFAEFSVDSIHFKNDTCKAYIHKGPRYFFGNTHIAGLENNFLRKNNLKNKIKYKDRFSINKLNLYLEQIISAHENNSFPFAQINVDSIVIDSNFFVHTHAKLIKNKQVYVNNIFVKGKYKISYNFLLHFFDIKKNDAYNKQKIIKIGEKINNSSFLTEIKPAEIDFFDNKADIYIYLNSKKANNFNGILGFGTDKNNGKLLFNGKLNLDLLNSFGAGESVNLSWIGLGEGSQNLDLKFKFPYIFNTGFGLMSNFVFEKKDSSYLSINFDAGANYFFSYHEYISLVYSYTKSMVVLPQLLDSSLYNNSNLKLLGLEYNLIKFDNIINPYRGFSFLSSIYTGNRNINSKNEAYYKLKFNVTGYLPVYKQINVKFALENTYNFFETPLYQNELLKIGGYKLLRGFDDLQVLASSYSVFTAEPGLLFDKNSKLFIFADIARVERKTLNENFSGFFYSTGAGINIETKAGILSLTYAIGKQHEQKTSFSSSKIHIGFYTLF